jgi:hypothetical protein
VRSGPRAACISAHDPRARGPQHRGGREAHRQNRRQWLSDLRPRCRLGRCCSPRQSVKRERPRPAQSLPEVRGAFRSSSCSGPTGVTHDAAVCPLHVPRDALLRSPAATDGVVQFCQTDFTPDLMQTAVLSASKTRSKADIRKERCTSLRDASEFQAGRGLAVALGARQLARETRI